MGNIKSHNEHSGMALIRILAAFLVVFIHVSPEAFAVMTGKWIGIDIAASISRVSVPIFFLISGYFAFNKHDDYDLKAFISKKFNRVFVPLVGWSIFYIWYNKSQFNLMGIFDLLTVIPAHYHLWFFYTLIPMILLTPILSKIVQHISLKELKYLAVIWLVMSLIPSTIQAVNYFCNGEQPILKVGKAQLFLSMLGFFLCGGFIKKFYTPLSTKFLLVIFTASCLATIVSSMILSYSLGAPSQGFFVYYSPFIAISSISLFMIFLKIDITSQLVRKVINFISSATLGIYLLHPVFIDYFKPLILKSNGVPSLIAMTALIFIISLAIIIILSKTPLVKRFV